MRRPAPGRPFGQVVLLDGSLIRTLRSTGPDNRRNYSGKHKAHGRLVLGITDTRGNLLWVSAARPGRSSEITTARHNKICAHLREHDLAALADLGFVGLEDDPDHPTVITGKKASKSKPLTVRKSRSTSSSRPNAPSASTVSPTSRHGGS